MGKGSNDQDGLPDGGATTTSAANATANAHNNSSSTSDFSIPEKTTPIKAPAFETGYPSPSATAPDLHETLTPAKAPILETGPKSSAANTNIHETPILTKAPTFQTGPPTPFDVTPNLHETPTSAKAPTFESGSPLPATATPYLHETRTPTNTPTTDTGSPSPAVSLDLHETPTQAKVPTYETGPSSISSISLNISGTLTATKASTPETESPSPTNTSTIMQETPSPTTAPIFENGSPSPSATTLSNDEVSTPTKVPTLENGSPPSSITSPNVCGTSLSKKAPTSENGSPSQRAPVVWLRSCDAETVTPIEGKVTGEIPSWLNGRLTRNGPGKIRYGDTTYNHLFDGSAYLHQFNIKDGHVTYQSRFLQSNTYKRNSHANRIVVSEFGTVACPDPCKTLLQRFMSVFEPPGKNAADNCSVNVVYMGDELYAMTETPNIRRLDPDTLDCIGDMTKLNNYIAVNQSTAHPHVDPDGTVYNMGNSYEGKKGPSYNIIKFPPPKDVDGRRVSSFEQAEIIASIPCQWKMYPSYYHSFGISDNYFIFVEMPFVFNIKKFLFNHYFGKPMFGALDWFPNEKTKFRIVRRDTGELIKTAYKADAFMTFHHTNAYEKDGQLVVDLCGISNADCVYQLLVKNFEDPDFEASPSTMSTNRRFVIPLDVADAEEDTNLVTLEGTKCCAYKRHDQSVEVVGEVISDIYFDLPRINYKHNGKDYSYAYGVELHTKGVEFCSLVKMNVKTGETKRWENGEKLVSEPVFVAAPGATDEDQGVILSALIDRLNPKYTALLVLDAKSWTEKGRVEFEANGVVTSTFHGMFAGNEEPFHRY